MKKIRTSEAQEGLVVAADIFDPAIGGNIPLLSRGVILTPGYIERLKKHGIGFLLVETPAGYKGAPGETFETTVIKDDLIFEGKVFIKCDVPPNTKIEAGESVIINGRVSEGCIIASKKGGVVIKGVICGTKEDPVKITSFQNLTVQAQMEESVIFSDIKAYGDIIISCGVGDSSISCKGELRVDGKTVRSQLYSQTKIRVRECGDETRKEPCILMVRPYECTELAQKLLKLDSRLSELAKEKEKLQNVIDLIKKLGKDVGRLPEDKRLSLASGAKIYKDIEGEMSSVQFNKEWLKEEAAGFLTVKRIIISGIVCPGVKVSIENFSAVIMKKENAVAFYVKDSKLVFSQYVEMG